MADKYLKEDASGGYQLEDGSGVLLLDAPVFTILATAEANTRAAATTSLTITIPSTTAGSEIVVGLSSDAATPSEITCGGVSLTGGGITLAKQGNRAHNNGYEYLIKGAAASTTSIAVTWNASCNSNGQTVEYSLLSGYTTALDTTNTLDGVSATADSGSATPSVADSIAVAMDSSGASDPGAATGGFTDLASVLYTASRRMRMAYKVQTSAAAAQATWPQTSANWDALVANIIATAAAATNAPAEVATGTGTAYNASVSIKPTGGLASGTGAASNPTPSVAPNGGNAAGTGAAFNATTQIAPHGGLASGTGANGATPSVAPNAGNAAGTGAAFGATTAIAPHGGLASGTGTASTPSESIAPTAGIASGTGAAQAPAPSVAPNAGNAAGTGTSFAPGKTVAPTAGNAAGTGTASNPGKTVAVNGGIASGTGTAFDATVSTSSGVSANAEAATGTGSAFGPSLSVAPTAGVGAATGTAFDAFPWIVVAAGLASATGDAYDATAATDISVTGGQPPLVSAASYIGSVGTARRTLPRGSVSHPKPGA